jgi:hypothetical protein
LQQLKEIADSMVSKEDIKNVSSAKEFFDVFIRKSEEKIEKEMNVKKDLLNIRIQRIELIDKLLTESPQNEKLNFVKIRSFSTTHKAVEAFQSLESSNPEKFKFESLQQMSLDGRQNSVNFLLHGDLEEIKDVIKTTSDPSIKYLKSIANIKFEEHFESHKERNIIFENNQVINLNQIDTEDFNVIFKNKNKKQNKI